MPNSTKLVLSDLHLGTGQTKGLPNLFDDFRDDERFAELLHYAGQGARGQELELILNGDIFDFLKVPINGLFPEAITASMGVLKLELCLRGHPLFVEALRTFLRPAGRSVTVLPGNHDMELVFPEVQARFTRALLGADRSEQLRFICQEDHLRLPGGVEIHHGHQFEALQAFDFKRLVLEREAAEPILNLPWGSLFILQVLNKFKEERPYLDKVKPFWPIFGAGLFFDTRFTVRAMTNALYYFWRARFSPRWRGRRPFTKLGRFVKDELSFFRPHEETAVRLFKARPELHALIMGHTHTEMVRTFGRGEQLYINTGTWVPMVNLTLEKLGEKTMRHFALIKYDREREPRVALMRWHGEQVKAEEVVV